MRMPADHLFRDAGGDIVKSEMAQFLRHLSMEDDLEQ
jgi:hypothetical protein